MLTLGPRGGKQAATGSPVGMLLECHQRIRHFTTLAATLAGAAGLAAPPEQQAAAALALGRYFTLALPLHAADEDESLAPLVRGRQAALDDALGHMTAQHGPLHAEIAHLAPLWARIAVAPDELPGLAAAGPLGHGAQRLAALWDEHLSLEESVIFPAAAQILSAAESAILAARMRARRAAPGTAVR